MTQPPQNTNSEQHKDAPIPLGALFILVLGAFMAILDTSIVNVALPRMITVFGSNTEDMQWVLTGYMLTSGVIIPITGFLSDRFGGKRMYILSIIAFTIGSAFCSLAWSTNSLIVARVIQALGGGMIIPITMSMIFRIIPREKIGMALGIWGVSAVMAPAIGPTLGGYLVDNFSWHWIFTINIPIGIGAVILSLNYLEETPIQKNVKADMFGVLLSVVACFSLLLALSDGQDKGWTSQYIVSLFIVSGFTMAAFVMWELSIPNPLIDIRLLRNPVLVSSLIATCLSTIALFSVVFLIPIYAQNLLGFSPMKTGLLMMPMSVVTGLMMPISGRLFDKFGAFTQCFVGMLLVIVVTYYLHTLTVETNYHYLQLLLCIRAVGLGLATMPLTTAGMNTVPQFLVGRATALNNTVRQVSASMGIAFLTYVLIKRQAFHTAVLSEHVNLSAPMTGMVKSHLAGYLASNGIMGTASEQGALKLISGMVTGQAYMNALNDTFVVGAVVLVPVLPLIFMLRKERVEKERKRQEKLYAQMQGNH